MSDSHQAHMDRLDKRIADCGRRIDRAHEKAHDLERRARAYDEAVGIVIAWNQQATETWQNLHQHIKGDHAWRQLEQENEERAAGFRQAQDGCAEAYDALTRQAKREHGRVLDIRDEQENLHRIRCEHEDENKRRRNPWG